MNREHFLKKNIEILIFEKTQRLFDSIHNVYKIVYKNILYYCFSLFIFFLY